MRLLCDSLRCVRIQSNNNEEDEEEDSDETDSDSYGSNLSIPNDLCFLEILGSGG